MGSAIPFPSAVPGPASPADTNSAVTAKEAKGLYTQADDSLLRFLGSLR